jgi:hypothetical protein
MNTIVMLKNRRTVVLEWATRAVAVLAICALAMSARAGGIGGPKALTYFNANLYVGAELLGALSVDPNDPGAVVAATSKIYADIVSSHPEIRVPAVARAIAAEQPDVVGLVEVYTVATAPFTGGAPGQFTAVLITSISSPTHWRRRVPITTSRWSQLNPTSSCRSLGQPGFFMAGLSIMR